MCEEEPEGAKLEKRQGNERAVTNPQENIWQM